MSSRPEVFRRDKEKESASANIYRFPSKPHPHTMLLVFEEFSYTTGYNQSGDQSYIRGLLSGAANNAGSRGRSSGITLRGQKSIELPFPKQLSDASDIVLNGFSRDPLAEKLANGLDSLMSGAGGQLGGVAGSLQGMGASLAQALGSAGSGGGLEAFKSTLAAYGVEDVVGVTRYLMQKAAPVLGEFGQSLNLVQGQVLNPKETLAFEGVGLRTHQFNWDLYPSNNADSDMIKRIVNVMKRSVLPSTKDFSIGDPNSLGVNFQRAFLKYPNICKIYLIGVDGHAFPKFKPAMVSNFTVDYGAAGQVSIMKGGKPAGVQIQLSLQELSIQTAQDYGEDEQEAQAVTGVDMDRFREEMNRPPPVASSDPEVDTASNNPNNTGAQ